MKIAVIKIGATGDVVRTTTLLHLFPNDEITWITAAMNRAILPQNWPSLKRIIAIEEINESNIFLEKFDLVISLDDDVQCAKIASALQSNKLLGIFYQHDKVNYTTDSSLWFDMGLSSKFGKEEADEIKKKNQLSYQEILFQILGHVFKGEECLICNVNLLSTEKKLIGLERRAGNRWPTKLWNKYDQLAAKLESQSYKIFYFEERSTFQEYIQDISKVEAMVCGDTLGMHLALALQKPIVTIFSCTSPAEIFAYERMSKIVSPFLNEVYYQTAYHHHAVDAISVDEVYNALLDRIA